MRRWPLVLVFVVAVFAAFAGGALWSTAGRAEPESPVATAASQAAPDRPSPTDSILTPEEEAPPLSPVPIATPSTAPTTAIPTPSPLPISSPTPPPTRVPTITSTPEPPTPIPTTTPTTSPTPVKVAPVESENCDDAAARITDLDKRGPPEAVTISGAGDLTGWYLVSVRGAQRFDFPDGLFLDGSVRVLSGADGGPDTGGQIT